MFDELGNTPDAVADVLRARSITGVRNAVRFLNPIVRYAHTKISGAYGIDLIQGDKLRIEFAKGEVTEIAVPGPVRRFLEWFDQGRYPDLEMPSGPG
jgi:hypothetical protein